MKVLKGIANVFGVLLALVLSLVLFVMLIAAPVISAAGSFTETDTLKKVVKNIDYKELLAGMDMEEAMGESGLDPELIATVMESGMMDDLVEVYADGIFDLLEGKVDEVVLSPETVNDILQKYLDDIVPVVKAMIGDEYPVPDEMIRSMTSEMLKEYAGEFAGMFPSAADLGLTQEVMMAVRMLRDGTILWGIIGVIGVISILILVFRFVRFKGFMWLTVVYALCGGLIFLTSMSLGDAVREVVAVTEPGMEALITPLISILAAEMMKGAGVLVGMAVLFVLVFVIGRKLMRKRREAMQAEPMM
jgi:hypothetical protein